MSIARNVVTFIGDMGRKPLTAILTLLAAPFVVGAFQLGGPLAIGIDITWVVLCGSVWFYGGYKSARGRSD